MCSRTTAEAQGCLCEEGSATEVVAMAADKVVGKAEVVTVVVATVVEATVEVETEVAGRWRWRGRWR